MNCNHYAPFFLRDSASYSIVYITAATLGATSTSFQFNYTDAAGLQSGTPATYTLNWGAPLPVDFVRFTATAEKRKVRLDWATAQERNNKGFGVEHSTDGSHWKTLGFVSSKGTDGNSSTALDYVFTITSLLPD